MVETSVSLLDRLRREPDGASWRRLVELYTPLLEGWLRRYDLQAADVDDLVQDVLAVVLRELPQFDHNRRPGAFRKWLRTVLVNRLRKFWQRRHAGPAAAGGSDFLRMLEDLEDPDSDTSRRWDREHDAFVARRLLRLIEPDFAPTTWRAFQRLVLEGVPAAEVAKQVGITRNAVFIAKSRVLSRLRAELAGLTG